MYNAAILKWEQDVSRMRGPISNEHWEALFQFYPRAPHAHACPRALGMRYLRVPPTTFAPGLWLYVLARFDFGNPIVGYDDGLVRAFFSALGVNDRYMRDVDRSGSFIPRRRI